MDADPAPLDDHTASGRDQTASDRDQTSTEQDQARSNDDQDAADADVARGADRATYERTTKARAHAAGDGSKVTARRQRSGRERADTAKERDRAAALRDARATIRDAEARLCDQETDAGSSWQELVARGVRDRELAAADRELAANDRRRAAADREIAAREGEEALRLRRESAALMEAAATDRLTATRTRVQGLDELARELARTRRRQDASLMLAFVGVDRLEQINDSKGHFAGDALLRLVGRTLIGNFRPYDVIVRYGGDEFLCAMPDMGAPEARARFLKIGHALAAVDAGYSLSFGLAQATEHDTLDEVIARATADLLAGRG